MSWTAKSIILDIADCWGGSQIGIRQIDFWYAGSKITLTTADFTADATTDSGSHFLPEMVFDTSLSKTGTNYDTSWYSVNYTKTNQRLLCVFDTAITFDTIKIVNAHSSGSFTNSGAKNVVINISTDSITDTTYNATISNSTEIFDVQLDEHSAVDEVDEQVLTLAYNVTYDGNGNTSGSVPTDSTNYVESDTVTVLGNTGSLAKTGYTFAGWCKETDGTDTIYAADDTFSIGADHVTLYAVWDSTNASYNAKSVILDIADNWGNTYLATIRSIDFWNAGVKLDPVAADFTAYATTEYSSFFAKEYAFDTSLSKTGGSADTSWSSANTSVIEQRLICVFDTTITFDEIRVNNAHDSGTYTDEGVKNVVITVSTDAITNTTYEATISNATVAFSGQFDEHSALDDEDEQILSLNTWPQVTTNAVSAVTDITATLNGQLTDMAGEVSLDVYFEYGETTSYGTSTTAETLTALGNFDADITSLTADTTYHFRTAVTDGADTWYGEDQTFTTLSTPGIFFDFPSLSFDIQAHGAGFFEATFSSLSFEITNRDTGVLASQLSMLSLHSAGTVSYETDDFSAEFPSLELSIFSGSSASLQLPMFQLDAEGTAGHAGDIAFNLPGFSFASYTGAQLSTDLLSLSMGMEGTLTVPAFFSAQLPALGFSGVASRASEGDIDITLSMLQASMEATAGIVGSISIRLPRFSMGIIGLPGAAADLEGTFRIMKFSAEGSPSGPGTISAELPILEMEFTSGSIESDVLRYNWERVR